jgi:hypothetical protein
MDFTIYVIDVSCCSLEVMVAAIYFVIKNLVLPRNAGSSMGQACPALRGSEFSGSAKRIAARV